MTRLTRIYLACAVAMLIAALLAWGTVRTAQASAGQELAAWTQAQAQARTIVSRLERLPVSRTGAPQPDHVATLARRVLVTAGVGQDALAGIQPLGDATLPGGDWHRQQVLLQLRGLSTRQTAAVVDAVARTDPSWAVTSCQLTHIGTADTYDAGLALTTLYPAHP